MLPKILSPFLLVILLFGLLATIPSVASARGKQSVSITIGVTDYLAPIGTQVKFFGSVSGPTAGARVKLLEKINGSWVTVKKGRVRANGTYRISETVGEGRAPYRTKVVATRKTKAAISYTVYVEGESEDPEPDPDPNPVYNTEEFRYQLGILINKHRADNGLSALRRVDKLDLYAQSWADQQQDQGYTDNRSSFVGSPPGYTVSSSESGLKGSPREFFDYLMEYSEHLLLADFTHFGIGVSPQSSSYSYWTVDFAVEEGDTPPETEWNEDTVRALILKETNEYRAAHGLPPLLPMDELDTVAQNWTVHMSQTNTFQHNPNYGNEYPANWRNSGENIAAGYPPTGVIQGWIDSPGHRANILGDYTHIGIGYAKDEDSEFYEYYTQNFAKY